MKSTAQTKGLLQFLLTCMCFTLRHLYGQGGGAF
ncbi:hypothetical protein X750_31525 [Mesorhizobium sp. LNJC394B00]|nr:hypothetical protein X750_31525 [Mesorhizobium sp. LNJC394B00]